jgi:type I restriction enzyme S subunit
VSVSHLPIGQVVEPVPTWNPTRSDPSRTFEYIDLAAVDQDTKQVASAKMVACRDAPSRARQLVATGDILVSTVRPNLNAVAMVPPTLDGATASTGFCVLRPVRARLDGRYLFHWATSPSFVAEMTRRATGASYPAVSDRIILESPFPAPPLCEQRRIAAILDHAEALRAKRRRAIAKLDALAEAIFLEMFGDPATNPKGWPRIQLGDVVRSISDGPHVSPDYVEQGIPFLSTRHIRPEGIEWDDLKFISEHDAASHWKKCRPERGDVLYTKGGTTGIAKAVDFDRPFAIWVHIALLKLRKERANPEWLEAMLNSPYCYAQSQRFTHGIANHDLGLTRMVKINMYLPPFELQSDFAKVLFELKKERAALAKSLEGFDALFASLQHRAFRGEL